MVSTLRRILVPEQVEEPSLGIIREWFCDRRLVTYKITLASRTIIQTWAYLVLKTLEDWPADRPYLALHDVSGTGVSLQYAALVNYDLLNLGITAEGRAQVERLLQQRPSLRAQVALNFNLSVSGHKSLVNSDAFRPQRNVHPAVLYKIFYNRSKSLSWLAASLSTTASSSAD